MVNVQDDGQFKVALTGDFRTPDGASFFDEEATAVLNGVKDVSIDVLDIPPGATLRAEDLQSFDAIVMKRSPVLAESVAAGSRILHIARAGVGVEHLDLSACTEAGIIVTNTPESVRRPVASAAVTLVLALAHKLFQKNRLATEGRWQERRTVPGTGLRGKVLGVIGCGNIGADILQLARPWEMNMLVAAPSKTAQEVAEKGGTLADLSIVLEMADFLVLACPLTDETYRMIDAAAIALMKPTAYVINIARGPLIDEEALIEALREGRLAGAGLDVFDPEPPAPDNPLLQMENVIATAHNLGFSDELNLIGNSAAAAAVAAVARREIPSNIVNKKVLEHPRIKAHFSQ